MSAGVLATGSGRRQPDQRASDRLRQFRDLGERARGAFHETGDPVGYREGEAVRAARQAGLAARDFDRAAAARAGEKINEAGF